MTSAEVQGLIMETIRDPKTAATRVLSMELPQQWLWMALALMCVLNAIVYSISLQVSPPMDPSSGGILIPPAFRSPVLFTLFLFGALALTIFALQWIGQAMGGSGSVQDMLILITWLQVLRLVIQVLVLVLSVTIPILGALVVLAATVWGVYILAHFISTGHRFENVWKGVGVMVLSFLAILVGTSMLFGLFGGLFVGDLNNV